jgi:outer membrane protein
MAFGMTKKATLIILACLMTAALTLPSLAAAQGKIGVVDMEEAINNTKAGKRAQAELKRKFEKYEKELKASREEIQKLQKELENSAMLLKPEAKLSKQRDLERLVRQFQDRQRDASQDMNEAQREAFKPILKKMKGIIENLGKKGGYTLITETRAVLYAPNSANITQQVIAAYDKSNP